MTSRWVDRLNRIRAAAMLLPCLAALAGAQAADDGSSAAAYMGAPVEWVKAPNGAIANKKLLDRAGDFNWLKPAIENPAKGVWVFGGYGLAPMSFIEAEDGLIAFDTGDAKHDGELLLQAVRTVSKKPIKVIIYGHSHTVAGAGVLAEGIKEVVVIGHSTGLPGACALMADTKLRRLLEERRNA